MEMTGVPGYVVLGVSGARAFVRGLSPEIYRYFFGFPETPEMTVGVCLGRFNAIQFIEMPIQLTGEGRWMSNL